MKQIERQDIHLAESEREKSIEGKNSLISEKETEFLISLIHHKRIKKKKKIFPCT